MAQINKDGNNLLVDEEFGDFDDVAQLLMRVNSKWENLRSSIAATELKFRMIAENYPSFTGTLSVLLSIMYLTCM